jgi:hypothetical protein
MRTLESAAEGRGELARGRWRIGGNKPLIVRRRVALSLS